MGGCGSKKSFSISWDENIEVKNVTKEIFKLIDMSDVSRFGAIAQLVEHLHGMQGASGSSPLGSILTIIKYSQ